MFYEGCCLFPTGWAITILSFLALASIFANPATGYISNTILANVVCGLITIGVVVGLPLWKFDCLPSSWFHNSETSSLLDPERGAADAKAETAADAAKKEGDFSTALAIAASAPTATSGSSSGSGSNNDNDNTAGTAPTQRKRRMYFLDNIKSALTVIVVMHHCGCAFGPGGWYLRIAQYNTSLSHVLGILMGLNQSYFMCAFFFISGYFTVSGFKKRGRAAALLNKLKRLGIPFLVYLYGLGPLLNWTVKVFLYQWYSSPYMADPGPPWFLAWLIILNTGYALFADEREHHPEGWSAYVRPDWTLMIWAAVIGTLNLLVTIFCPGNWIMMPSVVLGCGFMDVAAFALGTIAKRDRWFERAADPNVPEVATFLYRQMWAVIPFAVIYGAVQGLLAPESASGNLPVPTPNGTGNSTGGGNFTALAAPAPAPAPDYTFVFAAHPFFGLLACILTLGLINFFRLHLDYSSDWTKFFSRNAYCVYIIHPWVVAPLTMIWLLICQSMGIEIDFIFPRTASTSKFDNDGQVWLGWLFVTVVSQLVVWPLACIVRMLPGASEVL